MLVVLCNSFFYIRIFCVLDGINVSLRRGRREDINLGAGSAGLVRSIRVWMDTDVAGGLQVRSVGANDRMDCVEESGPREIIKRENLDNDTVN